MITGDFHAEKVEFPRKRWISRTKRWISWTKGGFPWCPEVPWFRFGVHFFGEAVDSGRAGDSPMNGGRIPAPKFPGEYRGEAGDSGIGTLVAPMVYGKSFNSQNKIFAS